ncbi:hypothetical protein MMC29_005691 [Sticta canariensis]|nr:hypothetical protein [Sticta canariensis]
MHLSLVLLATGVLPLVAGHCKITSAKGDLGGKGTALGITDNDGNSQSDVTVFSGGKAKPFGDTPGGGDIDPATALPAAMGIAGNTLPQVSIGGTVTMNLHQVNGDGAGPMKCSVDATASGDNFKDMAITTNVPGDNGRSNAANADFPLVAKMPDGVSCTGTVAGVKNVCMVKCQNPSGPFGGTVAVQTGDAGTKISGTADSDTEDSGTANSTTTTGADAAAGTGSGGNTNGTDTGGAAAAAVNGNKASSDGSAGKNGHRKGHNKGDENGKGDKDGKGGGDGKGDKDGNGGENGKEDKAGSVRVSAFFARRWKA